MTGELHPSLSTDENPSKAINCGKDVERNLEHFRFSIDIFHYQGGFNIAMPNSWGIPLVLIPMPFHIHSSRFQISTPIFLDIFYGKIWNYHQSFYLKTIHTLD